MSKYSDDAQKVLENGLANAKGVQQQIVTVLILQMATLTSINEEIIAIRKHLKIELKP